MEDAILHGMRQFAKITRIGMLAASYFLKVAV